MNAKATLIRKEKRTDVMALETAEKPQEDIVIEKLTPQQERAKREKELMKVWVKFKGGGETEELRNFLMEAHLHLVKYNAERIYSKLPDEVELDDLISAGVFGLMDAINSYDLERGVKFSTYCAPRIRGASSTAPSS